MAATAGTLMMRGAGGRTYTVDLYVPDATATFLTFNSNGLAASTSPADYRVPEDVVIEDIFVAAAPTAVGGSLIVDSANIQGGTVRWAAQLVSLNNRPKLAIGLKKGSIIKIQQF